MNQGTLWVSSGEPLGLLGTPFGAPWGSSGPPWGSSGGPVVPIGEPWGLIGGPGGVPSPSCCPFDFVSTLAAVGLLVVSNQVLCLGFIGLCDSA